MARTAVQRRGGAVGRAAAALVAAILAAPGWPAAPAAARAGGEATTRPATTRPAAATRPAGLAARYPGDRGIERDPAVILHEDFEDAQAVFARGPNARWTNISNRAGALKLVRSPAEVHGGGQALRVTATLGRNTGGHLFTRFRKGYGKLHARFCVKFAKDIDYIHHFVHMAAELPAYHWPTGGAGERPRGDAKFTAAIEPWGRWGRYPPPGGWHFYCYWWQMPRSGDGKFWGADPGRPKAPYAIPERGRWYCVEFMVKCNSPGRPDGEIALWIDGRRLAQHKGVNWRSSAKLKLNAFWLMLYVTEHSAKRRKVNAVCFDDVVVATAYVGPPARRQARPAPVP
jgi:hypothetical protein